MKNLYDTPRVGGDILNPCTKCKMELAHVVISMVDNKPFRVMCKTCRSEHRFRTQGVATRASKSSLAPKKPAAPPRARIAEIWERKVGENEKKGRSPKPYSVQGQFKIGELLNHAKFGLGVVEEVRQGGKILVLFRDDQRILVHKPEEIHPDAP